MNAATATAIHAAMLAFDADPNGERHAAHVARVTTIAELTSIRYAAMLAFDADPTDEKHAAYIAACDAWKAAYAARTSGQA